MPRVKTYRSLDEMLDIFGISLSTLNAIIKKHKIDSFTSKGKTQIHAKDFYKIYVTHYNPSLFDVGEKKEKKQSTQAKVSNSDIFQKLFGSPDKRNVKRKVVATSLISAKQMK